MSVEQERIVNGDEFEVPKTGVETGVDKFDAAYPKPMEGQAAPVVRPDVDEESLGYN